MSMTAAVYRNNTATLSIPQTQNTALVLEFNCLYTHDVRRKQKRWQDGFLRFHTFNKRVMVYDIPRNFIGDTHWKASEVLQDGDEVMLEKDGVIVQVAETIGRTETDLSEVRKSKKKSSSEKASSSPLRQVETPASVRNNEDIRTTGQLKHRSLNALLGPSRGTIGKATIPTRSPYEEHHADSENQDWENGRPSKRPRNEPPQARNVTQTTKLASGQARSEAPLWARTADWARRRERVPSLADQKRLETKEVIDISDDPDEQNMFLAGFSSDAFAPPSSPKQAQPAPKNAMARSSSPAFQTQKLIVLKSRATGPNTERPANGTATHAPVHDGPRAHRPTHQSGTKARASQLEKVGASEMGEVQTTNSKPTPSIPHEAPKVTRPSSNGPGQTLRIAATRPKKRTLLCQDQLPKKPSRLHSANTEIAVDTLLDIASQDGVCSAKAKTHREQLEQRLARITKKAIHAKGDTVNHDEEDANTLPDEEPTAPNTSSNMGTTAILASRPQTPQEQHAFELAQLDQMIMPPDYPGSPERLPSMVENRQLRRVVSETSNVSAKPKRAPGAPVRFTPSPAKKLPSTGSPTAAPATAAAAVLPTKHGPTNPRPPRAKKLIQRAVSLNTNSNGTSTVILSKPFETPKPPRLKAAEPEQAPDPWSREAFDLFAWRPPGWDEERWCRNVEAVV